MRVVIDVEANALHNPTKVWCIVCKDIDKGDYHVFKPYEEGELERFRLFDDGVSQYVGHNVLGWDANVLSVLCGVDITSKSLDTLILSRMIDYPRDSHSIEDYGKEFGIEKGKHNDFSKWSLDLERYCIRDVEICHKIYTKYHRYINNGDHQRAIRTEHEFQMVANSLSRCGFGFDTKRATRLREKVLQELGVLDKEIQNAFRPKLVLVKEIHPRVTQYGTLHRGDFRWCKDNDLSEFNGGPFCRCKWQEFNPASHRQIVDVLQNAGWKPTDRTRTHIEHLREAQRGNGVQDGGRDHRSRDDQYGWKINETNLSTLPDKAPKPARTLARRILLEARRRTLTEWLELVKDDRVHGRFYSIGAWTHRMAHQNPNMANIPTGSKLFGNEMRSLWRAPSNRLLVGVDAESIQLRIFAHYIDDREFTHAIVSGSKSDKTDPHSLNQRILGDICKDRATAKTYIYAMLLGARDGKLAQILGCDLAGAQESRHRIMARYKGFEELQRYTIPKDARRGYFIGLDGRKVRIPGETFRDRCHLALSGYLQNGESVVMKMSCLKWINELEALDAFLVNFVHDEWQTECPNDMSIALSIAKLQADSLTDVGEKLGLRCPLAGSFWSDRHNDYSIGINWSQTH